jgi:hypothetical protein
VRQGGKFRVHVSTDEQRPLAKATVSVRWRSADGGVQVATDKTDEGGNAYFDPVAGQVFVSARHRRHGVQRATGWSPGSVAIVLEGGPDVIIDVRAIPKGARAILRIVSVRSGAGETRLDLPLTNGNVDLGVFPSGLLQVGLSDQQGNLDTQNFLIPDVPRITCPLAWPQTDTSPALQLGDGQTKWTLRQAVRPAADGRGITGQVASDPAGRVRFPLGLPRSLCRADAPGLAPVLFFPTQLRKMSPHLSSVPVDPGAWLNLDLHANGLPRMEVVLLHYLGAGRGELPITVTATGASSVNAAAIRTNSLALLAEIPAQSESTLRMRVPSAALIGVFGEGKGRRVRMFVKTGTVGSTASLQVTSEASAEIVVVGGAKLHGAHVVVKETPSGTLQLQGPIDANLDDRGIARISGMPVPFVGTLNVSREGQAWWESLDLQSAIELRIHVDQMRSAPEQEYAILATTDTGEPAVGAVVHWVGQAGEQLFSRTDAGGLSTIEAAKTLTFAAVSLGEDLAATAPLGHPGTYAVSLRRSAKLRIALGGSQTGFVRKITVSRGRVVIYRRPCRVMGPASFLSPPLRPGPYRVRLLSDTGQQIAVRDVSVTEGAEVDVEFP